LPETQNIELVAGCTQSGLHCAQVDWAMESYIRPIYMSYLYALYSSA